MDARAAHAALGSAVFLDVREPYEWAAGHVEGSVHIPLMQLPERFGEIPNERPVIAVCQIGQRSELAARFLTERGFEAHNLEGGVAAWQANGLPLVGDQGSSGEIVDGYARDFDGLLSEREEPR
jgi:rhodanese-related sulfurtransferase